VKCLYLCIAITEVLIAVGAGSPSEHPGSPPVQADGAKRPAGVEGTAAKEAKPAGGATENPKEVDPSDHDDPEGHVLSAGRGLQFTCGVPQSAVVGWHGT
jgi:hypothetical protein